MAELITANQFQLQPNIAGALTGGFQAGQQIRQGIDEQQRQSQFRQLAGVLSDPRSTPEQKMQAQQQIATVAPERAQKLQQAMRQNLTEQQQASLRDIAQGAVQINAIQTSEGRLQALKDRRARLIREGKSTLETDQVIQALEAGNNDLAQQMLNQGILAGQQFGFIETAVGAMPAEQRAFEALIKDLPEKEKKQATLIKLGLEPRAVGSAIQTISEKGIEDEIGSASAVIKQREKFGELTGASRAKTIDKGFEQVNRIGQNINTIDRAISALERGAKTGAIERFLPSMRAASVELENIRNQFALDVIGGVTLGAISESELDLAKQVGLPEGLDEPELIEHLRARKAAQEKLRNYYREQIDHLDGGGTVASFLRMKERQLGEGQAQAPVQEAAQPAAPKFLGFE